MKPRPRTPIAAARFSTSALNFCCKYAPTLLTLSSSCSSSTMARNSKATRQANGPPPQAVPCCPGEIAVANSSFVRYAPSGSRLGNGDHVGRHVETLESKNRPRASQPTLNLVEDQRRAMTVRQRATLAQELHGTLVDSAFAENRLEHDGASIVVHRSPQPFQIVLLHEGHVFEQRLKSLAVLGLPRERQSPERAAVIRP